MWCIHRRHHILPLSGPLSSATHVPTHTHVHTSERTHTQTVEYVSTEWSCAQASVQTRVGIHADLHFLVSLAPQETTATAATTGTVTHTHKNTHTHTPATGGYEMEEDTE